MYDVRCPLVPANPVITEASVTMIVVTIYQ